MYSSKIQLITNCNTSQEAFNLLQLQHEKHSGMTQLQLIQRLGQIWLDDNPHNYDTQQALWRDLVYQINSIGLIDTHCLGLLFLFQNLKTSHPTVHDALAPAIMDGWIMDEMLDTCMQYHFKLHASQINQTQQGGLMPIPSMALLAFASRLTICNNCKKGGHTVEFCIAPRGKLAGLSAYEAIMCQHAAHDANRAWRYNTSTGNAGSPTNALSGGNASGSTTTPISIDNNSPTIILNGQHYHLNPINPPANPPTAHSAHVATAIPSPNSTPMWDTSISQTI